MPALYDPSPKRPLARDEKWISALFFLVFFASLGAELLRDFTPLKLGLVFVVLAWLPLLFLHELGHALMAKALGWHVYEVVIGQGREVTQFRVGSAYVSIKLAPLTGYVRTVPTELRYARLKQALVYFAGPGIELALALLIWLLVGPALLERSADLGIIALQSVCVTALLGALLNLVPVPFRGGVSDGLGMLLSIGASRKNFEWQLASPWANRVQRLLDEDQAAQALGLCDEGLAKLPDHQRLLLLRARCLAHVGDDAAAVAALEGFGDLERYATSLRAEILLTGAEAALVAGTRERLFDARRLADLALALNAEDCSALLIKGAALLGLDRLEAGIEQLEQASKFAQFDRDVEQIHAWLGIGYSRLGIPQRARLYLNDLLTRRLPRGLQRRLAEVDARFAETPAGAQQDTQRGDEG